MDDALFTGANLTNANLRESTLTNSNLSGANLTKAYLDGSTLTNANLRGADLTKATSPEVVFKDGVYFKTDGDGPFGHSRSE